MGVQYFQRSPCTAQLSLNLVILYSRSYPLSLFFFFDSETGSRIAEADLKLAAAQAGPELVILLPLPPRYRDYRYVLACLVILGLDFQVEQP